MAVIPVWREELRVRAYETDFNNLWKPASYFQAMQEAATNHARHLGYDYPDMFSRGSVWVLTRLKIYFHDFPTIADPVTVETWPRGIQQKIFFTRDFRITSPEGKPYASATSGWLLIDPVKRRMLLPNGAVNELPRNEGRYAVNELLEKIPSRDGLQVCSQVKADYSAIDLMGHVNNARYIEWVSDCFPMEKFSQSRLDWLQINYNTEVKPGELVTLSWAQDPQDSRRWTIEGSNQASGTKYFDVELAWKNNG
jgi:medium-chain acyl-[acyl-carrier-protein] hydrolase